MAAPPSLAGATQTSVTSPLPGVATSPVGAPGTLRGVALAVAGAESPAALRAFTAKV